MTRRASAAVARLQRALAAASAGVWEWDERRRKLTLSEELRGLLGADPFDGPTDHELALMALSRGDRARVTRAFRDAVAGDGAISLDIAAICLNGERRWLRVAGDVQAEPDQKRVRASGVAYDVTQRKRLELRQELGETVSRSLVRATSIEQAAPEILEAIARGTGMEIAGLWLPAADGTLRCATIWATEAARRAQPRFVEETLTTNLSVGQGLIGRAWDAKRPVWIDSVKGSRQRGLVGARAAFVRGLRSGAAIPLQAGDQMLGVIDLFSHRTIQRDEVLLEALASLGYEFALFILRQAAEASIRASEARQRMLVTLLQAQRETDDPDEVLEVAASALGVHLGASAVDVLETVPDGYEARCSWHGSDPSETPDERLSQLRGSELLERLRAGEIAAFTGGGVVPAEDGVSAEATGLAVPIMRGGRWQGAFLVHSPSPHRWTAAESGLAAAVSEHTWDGLRRARARAALTASEARFRSTFENAAVGVAHADTEGRWLRVNQRFCDIVGYPEADLLGRSAADITHPDDLPEDQELRRRMLAGEQGSVVREKRYLRPDGTPVWVEVTVSLYHPVAGDEYYITIVEDIGDRKAAEARLRTALAVKDEFLGLVSHELRTPMTVILGMSEVLAGGRLDPEQARSVAADIASSADDLHDLIESMLLLARLDRDAEHRDEPLLVDRVAQRAMRRQRQRDPSRDYTLESSGDVLVEAHPGLVERIVANLLSNASKYSRRGGEIKVVVKAQDGEVLVHVLDEGPALEDAELARLFEPFYRSPRSARMHGAGLGLAVVQRIAESFGGRAWAARSEDGNDFGFAIPQVLIPED